MGLVECVNHNLVEPYDVIYEKDGECDLPFATHCVTYPLLYTV